MSDQSGYDFYFAPWRKFREYRIAANPRKWRGPEQWNRIAKDAEQKMTVLCGGGCDVFEDWRGIVVDGRRREYLLCDGCGKWHVDQDEDFCCECTRFGQRMDSLTVADIRTKLFEAIDATPNLVWYLTTNYPQNIPRMWPLLGPDGCETDGCPKCFGHGCDFCHDGEIAFRANVRFLDMNNRPLRVEGLTP